MISLVSRFFDDLTLGKYLVVMPISRFVIEREFNIESYYFYPSGQVDIDELRVIPNKVLGQYEGIQEFEGQELREISSSITGISRDIFCTKYPCSFYNKT